MQQAIVLLGLIALATGQQLNVWPLPTSFSNGSSIVYISRNFKFNCIDSFCQTSDVVKAAMSRYTSYIFFAKERGTPPNPMLTELQITVSTSQDQSPLNLDTDESYTLYVPTSGVAVLKAVNQWGALRGIETFSQLVDWDPVSTLYSVQSAPVTISDAPRFPWRGLLIDSSRHFLPVHAILRQLDAMSYNKLNVLHWHISDDQSIPFESLKYPLLSKKGSWSPRSFYKQTEIKQIVSYAYERGIRIVPEFDMPAHCSSWGRGYPELIFNCTGDEPLLDVTSTFTYTFLNDVLYEVAQAFPDQFLHLGGDEVLSYACWNNSAVLAFMKQNNLSDFKALHNYFEYRIQKIAQSLGKTAVFWEETFDNGFDLLPSSTIAVWLNTKELLDVIKAGYRGLQNAGNYLDRQIPDPAENYFFEDTWKDFYMNEPFGNVTNLTPQEIKLVLGGEGSMWGEQVDATVIDSRIWPRSLAFAERFWSPRNVNDTELATPRLAAHRCRMVRRGINAGPIMPDFCVLADNY